MDRSADCCTSRASEGRGSSLTLGKIRERDTLLMVIWRKAELVWKIRMDSQSPALGIASPGEFDCLAGYRSLWGEHSFVVTAHAGQARGVEIRRNGFGCCHPEYACARFPTWHQRIQPGTLAALMDIRGRFRGKLTKPPNKAPEPTPTSVTPRAFLRAMKMKRRIADRVPARGAPDAVVAHL
jgi:hypothetical protein